MINYEKKMRYYEIAKKKELLTGSDLKFEDSKTFSATCDNSRSKS